MITKEQAIKILSILKDAKGFNTIDEVIEAVKENYEDDNSVVLIATEE